jgi:uncharacterized membrane protein
VSRNKNKNRQSLPGQAPSFPGFQITAHAAHFSGPLPPPEILIKYNEAVPGGAERIIAMAERQSEHRQELEKKVIETNCATQRTGPVYGFIICMTAILGGIYLIRVGKSPEGLGSIIAALVSLATVFIVGRVKQQKELREKAESVLPQTYKP